MENLTARLAKELHQPENYVQNVVDLLDGGSTIPFIARYRKELHGAMDDTTLRNLETRLKALRSLDKRKEEVTRLIDAQGKLTEELAASLEKAQTLTEVEDLYRPYKQKRRTRATIAREKGLEGLAEEILKQEKGTAVPEELAASYLNEEKGVASPEEALAGAGDILAEIFSDSAEYRAKLRVLYQRIGILHSEAATEDDSVYRLYYQFDQPLSKVQGHQVLALNRGEKEGFLKVSIRAEEQETIPCLARMIIRPGTNVQTFLLECVKDSFHRLIEPSLTNEIRAALTAEASEGAIQNFALNLKPLLMQPPVKGHVTMGLDPGYRMGCKVAVIDPTGKVLDTTVVYPTYGERQEREAIQKLSSLIRKHHVEHIAIGNGTASRETEQMTVKLIHECPGVSYMVVSEAGASVYSASELAAKEFPQFDVNLRSAVSIARRLQDPLAELVKIDPKAIGVGQYQHDMPQKRLDESLDAVVEDCVNAVGVDLNTASPSLLQHISGLNAATAQNIVTYREENGAFTSRKQLKKVPKLGPKAFEQCAGFLRVSESRDLLDHTGVHPESYEAARAMLALCGYTLEDVKNQAITALPLKLRQYGEAKAASECGIGVPTLLDIVKELQKPGRDPREELPAPIFRTDLLDLKDLKPGMELKGTVRNVIDFGAFVDIGVHQDGLVHISQICDRYIRHPSEVLSVGDTVNVVVLGVEPEKKRISLSIRQAKKS